MCANVQTTENKQIMSIERNEVREQGSHVYRQFQVLSKKKNLNIEDSLNNFSNVNVIGIQYGSILHFILSHQ